jgi:23S rRNA pseudouridine1911/1915/1917 synthase
MAKPTSIELPDCDPIPILYEDRSVIAIDKAAGWMLVPVSWQKTQRNLQAALLSSLAAGHFWARSRNLKFLKHVHRLDAETSGILLLARSPGALETISELFETRQMEKVYLAVTDQAPKEARWRCQASLSPDPRHIGRMVVDAHGKEAETDFRVLASRGDKHLIEGRPFTGRTHQIRVHLAESGCAVVGDELYGRVEQRGLGLRAVGLAYHDPFTRRAVAIRAPLEEFLQTHGFAGTDYRVEFTSVRPLATPKAEDRKPQRIQNQKTK